MLQGPVQQGVALQLDLRCETFANSRQQHRCIAWQHGMQRGEESEKQPGQMYNCTRPSSMAECIMGWAHPKNDSICCSDDAFNQEEPRPSVQPCMAPDSSAASTQQTQ